MRSHYRILSTLITLAGFALLVPLIANERPLLIWYVPADSYAGELAELQAAYIPEFRQALRSAGTVPEKAPQAEEPHAEIALAALSRKLEALQVWLDDASSDRVAAAESEIQGLFAASRSEPGRPELLEPALRRLEAVLMPASTRLRAIWAFPAWHSLGWGELVLLALVLGLGAGLLLLCQSSHLRRSVSVPVAGLLVLFGLAGFLCKLAAGPAATDYSAIRSGPEVRLRVPPPIPHASESIDLNARFSPPSRRHWLGTDSLGRDLLARLIWGARVSLSIALLALCFQLVIGTSLGGLAVIPARWVCSLFSRMIDGLISIPPLFLALAIGALLGANMISLVTAIALAGSLPVAQLFRAELRRVHSLDYITAVRNLGLSNSRIFCYHLLPNALAPVFGHVGYGVAASILMESSLSFLGLGVQVPAASWGGILSEARGQLELWWVMLFPGACIIMTVAWVQKAAGGTQAALAIKPRQA